SSDLVQVVVHAELLDGTDLDGLRRGRTLGPHRPPSAHETRAEPVRYLRRHAGHDLHALAPHVVAVSHDPHRHASVGSSIRVRYRTSNSTAMRAIVRSPSVSVWLALRCSSGPLTTRPFSRSDPWSAFTTHT